MSCVDPVCNSVNNVCKAQYKLCIGLKYPSKTSLQKHHLLKINEHNGSKTNLTRRGITSKVKLSIEKILATSETKPKRILNQLKSKRDV